MDITNYTTQQERIKGGRSFVASAPRPAYQRPDRP